MNRDEQRGVDMTGMRYGRLVALRPDPRPSQRIRWICACDCGGQKITEGYLLRAGVTQSCGCLQRERASRARRTHGHSVSDRTPEYRSWQMMKDRCLNPNSKKWGRYGGRGIRIHGAWIDDFAAFFRAVGPRPAHGYTLGRIDNDGHYEPGNVRWETPKQQQNNRGSNRLFRLDGEEHNLTEWARRINVAPGTILRRLASGWTLRRALTTTRFAP